MKINTVIDGQEIIIEGTVEEIKAFQDDNNKEIGVTPRLLSPEEKLDEDKIYNIDTEIEKLQKLEDGEYFVEGKITDLAGDSVEYENVILENNSAFMILEPTERREENGVVKVLINFDENDTRRVIENAELVKLESDNKQEEVEQEGTGKFKKGDVVEVLRENCGVAEGHYGTVVEHTDEIVMLEGYNKEGDYSKAWLHLKDNLRLIKRV